MATNKFIYDYIKHTSISLREEVERTKNNRQYGSHVDSNCSD